MRLRNSLYFYIKIVLIFFCHDCSCLDLEEALTLAYKNNPQFGSVQQSFLTQLETWPQALSGFLPDVTAQIIHGHRNLSYKYPIKADGGYDDRGSHLIRVRQGIFNGGRDMALLRAAQARFYAARGNLYDNEQRILFEAIRVYLVCHQNVELYNIAVSKVQFAQQQLYSEQEKLKLGESTITSVSYAQANFAKAEFDKARAFAEMEKAKTAFSSFFGIQPCKLEFPELACNLPPSEACLTEVALKDNFTLDTNKYLIQANKADVLAQSANLLPQLSFNADTINNNFNNTNNSFGQKLRDHSVNTELALTIPIFSSGGAEYSRIRQRKYAARKAVYDYEQSLNQVKVDISSAWEGFLAAKQQVEASNVGVKAAAIALEGMELEFQVGNKNIVDVLQAQDELYNAQQQLVLANVQHVLTSYQIRQVIGQLTAKALKLPVNYFYPEREFRNIKFKIVGF